jgi:hypothetical protein
MEAQAQVLHPRVNREELTELVELQRCLEEAEETRITEVGKLVVLVGDISKVPLDLGMPPILMIPQDPRMVGDILEEVGTILECLRENHTSGHDPWD